MMRVVYQRFIADAQLWERQNEQKLLLWCMTKTPYGLNVINTLFADVEPQMDGSCTEKGKQYCLAIKKYMNST